MKLVIENNGLKVNLSAKRELSFEELFKVHQLVTGKNDSLNVESNDHNDSKEPVSKEPMAYERGGMINRASLVKTPGDTREIALAFPHFGELVQAQINCPSCGYGRTIKVKLGYDFWRCPKCHVKLRLAFATGIRGEMDANGCVYKASKVFVDYSTHGGNDDFSAMYKHSDDPTKPDVYSTISEIKAYLDAHGVDYSHAKFKGDYIALIDKVVDSKNGGVKK